MNPLIADIEERAEAGVLKPRDKARIDAAYIAQEITDEERNELLTLLARATAPRYSRGER